MTDVFRRVAARARELRRNQHDARRYRALRRWVADGERRSTIAAVVHVYYPELWPTVAEALTALPFPVDIVVTVPDSVTGPLPAGQAVRVLRVPNRGRDVLPFLNIARGLQIAGYDAVLKLHTKRSPHAEHGDRWFTTSLASLVPSDAATADAVLDRLGDPTTGIVGPAEHYHPFPLVLGENIGPTRTLLVRALGHTGAAAVIRDAGKYGFFAGTMFWARLDALTPLLSTPIREFAPEAGQVNGTAAHALERLFCVLPQVRGRQTWALDRSGVRAQDRATTNLPAWAGPDDLRLDPRWAEGTDELSDSGPPW